MTESDRGTGILLKMPGCKYWYVQYYVKGKQTRVSTKTTNKEKAKIVKRRLIDARDRGVELFGDVKKLKYEDLRGELIKFYEENGRRSLQTTADGEYDIWGLKALDAYFKGWRVSNIDTEAVRKFVTLRKAAGKANDTIRGSLALLRRMFHICKDKVTPPLVHSIPVFSFPPPGKPRRGFVRPSDFESILKHLPVNLWSTVMYLYWCGGRSGESKQISWNQVYFDDPKPGKCIIKLEKEQVKNATPRDVPLPSQLIEILKAQEPKKGLVFDHTNLRKAWQKACVAAGLGTFTKVEGKSDPKYNGLTVHDLRRSAARNLRKAAVPESEVMAIGGWKTNAVFRRYDIVDTQDVVDAMDRLERFVNSDNSVKTLPASKRNEALNP
jgi:integrase